MTALPWTTAAVLETWASPRKLRQRKPLQGPWANAQGFSWLQTTDASATARYALAAAHEVLLQVAKPARAAPHGRLREAGLAGEPLSLGAHEGVPD